MRGFTKVNLSMILCNDGNFLVFFFDKRNKNHLLMNEIHPPFCGYKHVGGKFKTLHDRINRIRNNFINMNKISILFIISILCSFLLNAQTNKDTEKIKTLIDKNKFEKVLKYKSNKENMLDARALFYKGISAYQLSNDKKANKYFGMSVAKDSTSGNAYFYKGLTEYYLEKYSNAIASFGSAIKITDSIPDFYSMKGEAYLAQNNADSAITYLKKAIQFTDCNKYTYASLANAFQITELYDSAIFYYDDALKTLEPDDNTYENCSYNKGLVYLLMEQYQKSIDIFKKHLDLFPNDYIAIEKCIQSIVAQGESDEHFDYIKKLYEAKENSKLPMEISEMFCFEQFVWKDYQIMGFELFEEQESPIILCKHKYLASVDGDTISFKIQSERDFASTEQLYRLKLLKNDSLFVYPSFEYANKNYYKELTNSVIEILNNEIKPDTIISPYSNWIEKAIDKKYDLSSLENDGSSYEKAVKVKSVPEEYKWLRKYYPEYIMIQQSLNFNDKSPYDILSIDIEGIKKDIYFDISSFFGKGF